MTSLNYYTKYLYLNKFYLLYPILFSTLIVYMSFTSIQKQFQDMFNGAFGFRLGLTRLLHPSGVFYTGHVFDNNNTKHNIHVRYSIDTLKVPFTDEVCGYVSAFAIRIYKNYDNFESTTKINNKASELTDSGDIADCIFVKVLDNPPQNPNDFTVNDIFSNHSYFKPQSLKQALALAKIVATTRLFSVFSCVVKIENVLKLLGYPHLSAHICSQSIASLHVDTNDQNYTKLVLNRPNTLSPITFYINKTPNNPDTSVTTQDSNNIKFVHDFQPFNIKPCYKQALWRTIYTLSQYSLYTYKYFANTFSKDIYEEIPYQYQKINEISL